MEIGEPALQSHALKRRLLQILLLPLIFTAAIFSESKAFANGNPIELDQQTFYSTISGRNEHNEPTGLSGNYVLSGNITIPDGRDPVFTGIFAGVLNGFKEGGNYVISGLTRPLFYQISGVVKNLNLETVAGETGVQGRGALANSLESGGSVENVNVTGNVTGVEVVGGLVGYSAGAIIDSSMNGDVTGTSFRIGGLVGELGANGTITGSNANGDVTSAGDQVGGLVGKSVGEIADSSASGDVNGRWDVGGLVGYSSGDITLSHATGAVSGEDRVGGLVGHSEGDITFSSAKGGVSSTAIDAIGFGNHGPLADGDRHGIGGLVGYNTGNITNTFTGEADSDSPIPSGGVSGLNNVGGLVGFSSGNISNSRASGNVNEFWSCVDNRSPCIEYVGGLVGYSIGDIESSWASGDVRGENYIGGLVGQSDGDVTNSHAAGYVSGDRYVGGLVGRSTGVITNGETYDDKPLEPDYVSGSEFVGGLVGYSEGNVIDSVSRVPVSGGRYVGGLVGKSEGNVTNSVAEGEVHGQGSEVGGLVGYSVGDITDSSATGDVTGAGMSGPTDYVGGLVGFATGDITESSATGNVTGGDYVGGLVGGGPRIFLNDGFSDLETLQSIKPHYTNAVTWDSGTLYGQNDLVSHLGQYFIFSSTEESEGMVPGEENPWTIYVQPEPGDGYFVNDEDLYVSNGTAWINIDATPKKISFSFATGDVTGYDNVGGLVGRSKDSIENSYAIGDVIGNSNVGGLVGHLEIDASVTYSYATGDVTGNLSEGDGGDVGGLVGIAYGIISNSHATGDVSGNYDVGGLVGDLNSDGVIRNSYATGDVTASGFNDDWESGWGGLVGEFDGIIENSYATGNVLADYHAGSLVGYFRLGIESEVRFNDSGSLEPMITNSFATGVVMLGTRSIPFEPEEDRFFGRYDGQDLFVEVNHDNWALVFGGFIGCQEGGFLAEEEGDPFISCSADELTQSTPTAPPILRVVNTVGTAGAPAFEIIACKNNGLPFISLLSASYANTCAPNPAPASLSAALASAVQLNPKFNLLESTTLRLFLYLVGDKTIRITVEDFVVLGATGVNSKNLPLLLKLLKDVDLLTLDLNTINKNVKIANELLKKQKKKPIRA